MAGGHTLLACVSRRISSCRFSPPKITGKARAAKPDAQSVERLTAEREVTGSIPGAGPILRVLKYLRNEGTVFALQVAGLSRGSDDHVEMAVPSPVGDVKVVSPISTFVLNTLTLKKRCFFFLADYHTACLPYISQV